MNIQEGVLSGMPRKSDHTNAACRMTRIPSLKE